MKLLWIAKVNENITKFLGGNFLFQLFHCKIVTKSAMELSPSRPFSSSHLSQTFSSATLSASLQTDESFISNMNCMLTTLDTQDLHQEMKQLFNFSLKGNVEKVREILREYKELINCKVSKFKSSF